MNDISTVLFGIFGVLLLHSAPNHVTMCCTAVTHTQNDPSVPQLNQWCHPSLVCSEQIPSMLGINLIIE